MELTIFCRHIIICGRSNIAIIYAYWNVPLVAPYEEIVVKTHYTSSHPSSLVWPISWHSIYSLSYSEQHYDTFCKLWCQISPFNNVPCPTRNRFFKLGSKNWQLCFLCLAYKLYISFDILILALLLHEPWLFRNHNKQTRGMWCTRAIDCVPIKIVSIHWKPTKIS